MCSQPPKDVDDSWLLQEAFELISLIPIDTEALGFSGGEPTLYGDRLIELLHYTKSSLPNTAIDILSNGRAFKDPEFAKKYAGVQHPDMLIGIPIYSGDPVRHDYVVQSRGAFDETIKGIRSDHGPEFAAKAVRHWLARVGVQTLFITPDSP
jgi:MoaA/NifB/PqqE/SkfB family radical SAM enzyme